MDGDGVGGQVVGEGDGGEGFDGAVGELEVGREFAVGVVEQDTNVAIEEVELVVVGGDHNGATSKEMSLFFFGAGIIFFLQDLLHKSVDVVGAVGAIMNGT